jgi:hypothetical protein
MFPNLLVLRSIFPHFCRKFLHSYHLSFKYFFSFYPNPCFADWGPVLHPHTPLAPALQAILPGASSNKVCLLCENVFGLPRYPFLNFENG